MTKGKQTNVFQVSAFKTELDAIGVENPERCDK